MERDNSTHNRGVATLQYVSTARPLRMGTEIRVRGRLIAKVLGQVAVGRAAGGDPFHDDYTEVGDTCLQTLVRILKLPALDCQRGALHGLGHLKHAQTARVVPDQRAAQ